MTAVRQRLGPRRRSISLWVTLALMAAALVLVLPAAASHPEVSLPGSNFEIDTNANLKVDDPAPSIDWAGVSEIRKADLASGSGDDSFGQGTKEDTAVPTVVSGSIPPQKSDLLNFGVYLETTSTGARFLNMFWHRVQEPTGTTNMDFEFNQSSVTSANGVTPVRTAGDLLIQYDLSQGGTNPVLFLSRWVTAGATSQCQASNSLPCWGTKTNLTAAGDAAGSINTTAIPSADSDGLGNVSARTFGEAQIDFDALGGGAGTCTSFGSAYLKSRSSDSFTAALKDFIAPAATNISNCGSVIIRKETVPDEDPNTTLFGYTKAFPTDPASANTFTLTDDANQSYNNVLFGTGYTVDEDVIPTGWVLTGIDCSASSGVTPVIDLAAGTVTFAIDSATDKLDCTYTNTLQQGAIEVLKTSLKDDSALEGAEFDVKDSADALVAHLTTDVNGRACVDGLTFGAYTVTETAAPDGYGIDDTAARAVTVDNTAACNDASYGGESTSFTNTPLSEIQVLFRSLAGPGVTNASIDCGVAPVSENGDPEPAFDDTDETFTDLAPGTYTCTVVVDP
jgi:hypothetical protein